MPTSEKYTTPHDTIAVYVEACRAGDVKTLRSLFAANALMWGFYQGDYYLGSPQPFYDEVRDNPSPAETGIEYIGEITSVEQYGDIAQVTLREQGYLGADFTNLFQLALLDGDWLIVSKAYIDA